MFISPTVPSGIRSLSPELGNRHSKDQNAIIVTKTELRDRAPDSE